MWKDNIPYQSYQYRYENEQNDAHEYISSIIDKMDQESVANSM